MKGANYYLRLVSFEDTRRHRDPNGIEQEHSEHKTVIYCAFAPIIQLVGFGT